MSKLRREAGFTIMELMIATMVFSVILLLVTYGIIQIGNRYFKATLQSQTQTAARNAIDEVSRNLQFSDGTLSTTTPNSDGVGAYCINNTQYLYMLRKMQVQTGSPQHVLVVRPDPGSCAVPTDLSYFQNGLGSNERDLLGNRMRLAAFDVSGPNANGVFTITLRVVTGDDDLLCSPSAGCTGSDSELASNSDITCKGGAGSTYCAYSELSTAVTRRLSQ